VYPDGPWIYLDCLVVFATTRGHVLTLAWVRIVRQRDSDCLRLDANGPVISRFVDLSSRDDSGGICPIYELIGIPYNGWGCESPFVTNVLDTYILLLVSYDGK
jgi:hypothetical protein